MPRDHPTPAPDSPARRRAAEVKMVGYITVAHGGAQRLSEKWRHFVVHCLYSLFCTSPRCVGVGGAGGRFAARTGLTSRTWAPLPERNAFMCCDRSLPPFTNEKNTTSTPDLRRRMTPPHQRFSSPGFSRTMCPGQSASLYAPEGDRVSHGTSFLAPGSLARRRLARVIHHHHHYQYLRSGTQYSVGSSCIIAENSEAERLFLLWF